MRDRENRRPVGRPPSDSESRRVTLHRSLWDYLTRSGSRRSVSEAIAELVIADWRANDPLAALAERRSNGENA